MLISGLVPYYNFSIEFSHQQEKVDCNSDITFQKLFYSALA